MNVKIYNCSTVYANRLLPVSCSRKLVETVRCWSQASVAGTKPLDSRFCGNDVSHGRYPLRHSRGSGNPEMRTILRHFAQHLMEKRPLYSSGGCGVRESVNAMTKRSKNRRPDSERARVHAEMLKATFARPGVREAMRVYENWREKDRWLDAYRAATKPRGCSWNSDRTTTRSLRWMRISLCP